MRHVLALLTIVTTAFVSGCGSQAASTPPKPPAQTELPSTRAMPQRDKEPAPKLLAPPPAYGNKVVMAEGQRIHSTN